MSDTVIVAMITTVGSILVATLTQLVSIYNGNKSSSDANLKQENKSLKAENKRLQKQSDNQQEIIDYYRKKEIK